MLVGTLFCNIDNLRGIMMGGLTASILWGEEIVDDVDVDEDDDADNDKDVAACARAEFFKFNSRVMYFSSSIFISYCRTTTGGGGAAAFFFGLTGGTRKLLRAMSSRFKSDSVSRASIVLLFYFVDCYTEYFCIYVIFPSFHTFVYNYNCFLSFP